MFLRPARRALAESMAVDDPLDSLERTTSAGATHSLQWGAADHSPRGSGRPLTATSRGSRWARTPHYG